MSQPHQIKLTKVPSIHTNLACGGIEKPWDQLNQTTFAGTRPAHDCDGGACFDLQRDILENQILWIIRVGKAHIPKIDRAPTNGRRDTLGDRPLHPEGGLNEEDLLKSLHRYATTLDNGDHPTQRHCRPGQKVQVAHKCHEVAQLQSSPGNLGATKPEDDQNATSTDQTSHRSDHPTQLGKVHARFAEGLVFPREALLLALLHRIGLDHMNTAHVFLN